MHREKKARLGKAELLKIKALFTRYREMILYVFFGGLTTLLNIAAYWALTRLFPLSVSAATALAWVISVLFAYVTNRIWVFQSKQHTAAGILKEAGAFFLARAATGLMDVGIMALFVDHLHWSDLPVKLASNVLVIILNYVFSKLLVFRKERKAQ